MRGQASNERMHLLLPRFCGFDNIEDKVRGCWAQGEGRGAPRSFGHSWGRSKIFRQGQGHKGCVVGHPSCLGIALSSIRAHCVPALSFEC